MHAKCYGTRSSSGETLVVSSGNFTGPGMAQNVEAALFLGEQHTASMNFSWEQLSTEILAQKWMIYEPTLLNPTHPSWQLLYDESPGNVTLDDSETMTMIVMLGHSDTVRIQTDPGTSASKGTQYFWLSKDSFDFFPPLTIRNERGYKGTLSAILKMNYIDLGEIDTNCRITFEAENNLDFRLGTSKLRYTKLANVGDLACISRVGEDEYEMRIITQRMDNYHQLRQYAVHYIGHSGKMYGLTENKVFSQIIGVRLKECNALYSMRNDTRQIIKMGMG